VLPVVTALADQAVLSVDTTRAEVARRALDAGARIVNDVSGGLADPEMAGVIAASDAPYICMYSTGPAATREPSSGKERTEPGDPVTAVVSGLTQRLAKLQAAGVALDQVILDPGLGFAYPGPANWEVLGGLSQIAAIGRPVLVGASRKRFLDPVVPAKLSAAGGVSARDGATAAVSALAAAEGVWAVRVHEIPSNLAAVRVGSLWRSGGWQLPSKPEEGS